MKEQDKTLDEVERGNLQKKKFRIMIVKMIQGLGKRMEAKIEKMQEMFNKDIEKSKNKHLEELKSKQREMNNTITEMKNTQEGINSRITEAEEQITEDKEDILSLEEKMVEFTAAEQNKEKIMEKKK